MQLTSTTTSDANTPDRKWARCQESNSGTRRGVDAGDIKAQSQHQDEHRYQCEQCQRCKNPGHSKTSLKWPIAARFVCGGKALLVYTLTATSIVGAFRHVDRQRMMQLAAPRCGGGHAASGDALIYLFVRIVQCASFAGDYPGGSDRCWAGNDCWRRLVRSEVHERCRPLVVGHPGILQRAIDLLHVNAQSSKLSTQIVWPRTATIWNRRRRRFFVLPIGSDDVVSAPVATIGDCRGGQAAYDALVTAARLALARQVDGIVTAPLDKAALWRAGHHYPGHTELLSQLCAVNDFAMMLYLGRDSKPQPPDGSPPHPNPLTGGEGKKAPPDWGWCMSRCTWH